MRAQCARLFFVRDVVFCATFRWGRNRSFSKDVFDCLRGCVCFSVFALPGLFCMLVFVHSHAFCAYVPLPLGPRRQAGARASPRLCGLLLLELRALARELLYSQSQSRALARFSLSGDRLREAGGTFSVLRVFIQSRMRYVLVQFHHSSSRVVVASHCCLLQT